jgi:hypothetical protein
MWMARKWPFFGAGASSGPARRAELLEVHAHDLPKFGSSAAAVLNFLYKQGFRTYLLGEFQETYKRTYERYMTHENHCCDMLLVTRLALAD